MRRYSLACTYAVGLLAACSHDVATGTRREVAVGTGGAAAPSEVGNAGRFGTPGGIASPVVVGAAGSGSVESELDVRVHDIRGMTLEVITLACAGDCADIEAVARGGNPPYTFSWDDGSKEAKRRVCLEASKSLRITATDTAIESAEFGHAATMASADVMANVLACSDAGVPPSTSCVQEAESATCKLPSGAMLPEDITVKLIDEQQYFAAGADLPAGRYRLTYVDGCFSYGDPAGYGWTVHFVKASGLGCSVIGADGMSLMATPGTDGASLAAAYATYAECVAANCSQPALEFDHAGGKLGVARNGGTAVAEFDDVDGSTAGGRNPTFRLSRIDPCP